MLVWVEVAEEIRVARLRERGFSEEELSVVDAHPSEVEALKLREAADLVVRGDDKAAAVASVFRALN